MIAKAKKFLESNQFPMALIGVMIFYIVEPRSGDERQLEKLEKQQRALAEDVRKLRLMAREQTDRATDEALKRIGIQTPHRNEQDSHH